MNIIVNPAPAAAIVPPSVDDSLYEIIDGQRVELLPMSVTATLVTTALTGHLFSQTKASGRTAVKGCFTWRYRLTAIADRISRSSLSTVGPRTVRLARRTRGTSCPTPRLR